MKKRIIIPAGKIRPRILDRMVWFGVTRKRSFRFDLRVWVDHYDGDSYLAWKLGGLGYAGLFRWERVRRNGWGQFASCDHEDSDRIALQAGIKDGVKGVYVIWYAYRQGAGAITPIEKRPLIIKETSGFLGDDDPIFIPSGERFCVGCEMSHEYTKYWCIDHTGHMADHVVLRERRLSWLRYRTFLCANNGPSSPVAEQEIIIDYYKD